MLIEKQFDLICKINQTNIKMSACGVGMKFVLCIILFLHTKAINKHFFYVSAFVSAYYILYLVSIWT